MEVYSVDQVTSVDPIAGETTEYLPFYSLRHGTTLEGAGISGTPSRRPSARPNDRGTEVYLNLVNLGFDPINPSDPSLVVRTTCTNRELPAVLQQAGERLVFDLEAAAPAVAHPLRAFPVVAAAPSHAAGHVLAAGLAPLPESPLALQSRRGPRGAPGDPPALRPVRSRPGSAAARWSLAS